MAFSNVRHYQEQMGLVFNSTCRKRETAQNCQNLGVGVVTGH